MGTDDVQGTARAAMSSIERPAATAMVSWSAPVDGGRRSGPPSVAVYAANCTFPLGGEIETVPGWPATAEKFSVLIERVEDDEGAVWRCRLGFLAPDLVSAYVTVGAAMLIMEGPKVVGDAVIDEVFG